MRQKKVFFLIIVFAIFFAYITNFQKIPKNITLFQNEKYQIQYLKGMQIEGKNIDSQEGLWKKLATIPTNVAGNIELNLSTLGGLLNKRITVDVLPTLEVVPGGDLIGIKLYSKGVLIVGESKVQDLSGNWNELYPDGTFKAGDLLLKIGEYEVDSAEEVSKIVNTIGEKEITLTIERNKEEFLVRVTPIKSFDDGHYKIGLWVRDGAMGIGTLSFYSPEYMKFAALGHGISDEDSKKLIEIDNGEIYNASILSATKGRSEYPGELKGILREDEPYGWILENERNGIFGSYSGDITFLNRKKVEVASQNEVQLGNAKIICTVDESQERKEYDIEIIKIVTNSLIGNKGMMIKVTDEELIRKTGGIIQGMSGSPILQNGKLIGAVTHVYVNDPTKGYAVFAETMIEKMKK